jgi:hypothetical protein
MGEHSKVVSEGMKRVCSAFTLIVQPLGFKRGNGRKWVRLFDGFEETIYLSRSGATYGAPYSPSISIQLDLISVCAANQARSYLDHHTINMMKRSNGYGYHHRFNAKTGSTYDRCLQDLGLFLAEAADPWFESQRCARS